MGYSVAAVKPRTARAVEFSPNVSHSAVRHALLDVPDLVDHRDAAVPFVTMASLVPGDNGVLVRYPDVFTEAPLWRAIANAAGPDHPSKWVYTVLASAFEFASLHGFWIEFG